MWWRRCTETATRRVLSVGKNKGVLRKLTQALTDAGFDAEWTNDVVEAARRARAGDIDLVAFGRGVKGHERESLRAAFSAANPEVLFVDGLAPMIPLLVAQVEDAFSSQLGSGRVLEVAGAAHRDGEDEVILRLRAACEVEVTEYRLDWLYRTHTDRLLSE